MANHKYKNTSNQRAGCKLCRPWKVNGNHNNGWAMKRPTSDIRALQEDIDFEVQSYFEEREHRYEEGPDADFIDNVLPYLIEYKLR